MAKRDAVYEGQEYSSPYPPPEEQIHKKCEICGLDIVVNNWPDRKSRTPKFKDFVICADCDPRHPEDRYLREGYRILFPRKLRIVKLAQVTRAMSKKPCMKPDSKARCKRCAACVAFDLFPPF